MNHILVFSIILVTKFASGFIPFPVDEDSNYDSICKNASVVINFSGLQLNNIKKNFLSSPVVYCLDLSDNHIESIDDNAFNNLPNLKLLNMSNNNFDINSIFNHGHLNLETLILDNNTYNCEEDAFYKVRQDVNANATYPKLKKLFIRHYCGNIDLFPNFKSVFSSLTHLYLRGTGMVADVGLQWLPNTLEYLDLSDHSLSGITLRNLDNLQYLIISDPYGKRLNTLNLQGLSNLKYLSVASNGPLDYVEFPIVPSLTFLDISDNNIRLLQSASFYHMTNLKFLNLSSNCIRDVEGGTFDRLVNLEELVLEGNQISAIPTLSNEKLKVLHLSCNKIERVEAGTFKKLTQLSELYLHYNKITFVDEEAFVGLGNLDTLILSNNLLMSLPHNWMLPIVSIRKLSLGNNSFACFPDLALSELSPLKLLLLSDSIFFSPQDLNRIPENVTVFINSFSEKCTRRDEVLCNQ